MQRRHKQTERLPRRLASLKLLRWCPVAAVRPARACAGSTCWAGTSCSSFGMAALQRAAPTRRVTPQRPRLSSPQRQREQHRSPVSHVTSQPTPMAASELLGSPAPMLKQSLGPPMLRALAARGLAAVCREQSLVHSRHLVACQCLPAAAGAMPMYGMQRQHLVKVSTVRASCAVPV